MRGPSLAYYKVFFFFLLRGEAGAVSLFGLFPGCLLSPFFRIRKVARKWIQTVVFWGMGFRPKRRSLSALSACGWYIRLSVPLRVLAGLSACRAPCRRGFSPGPCNLLAYVSRMEMLHRSFFRKWGDINRVRIRRFNSSPG